MLKDIEKYIRNVVGFKVENNFLNNLYIYDHRLSIFGKEFMC